MTAGQPVDPFLPIEEALQRLVDDLDRLNTPLVDPDENPDNEDPFFDERARVMATVAAVAQFMQSLPELAGKERERPLVTLLRALHDVHEGRESGLFSSGQGGPSLLLGVQFSRARIAAAMTILHERAGYKKEAAARLVSRLVPNRDAYLFNNKTPRHEQVTQWRRDAMEKRHPDVTRHYRDIVAGVKAAGLDPEQAAKKLLNP